MVISGIYMTVLYINDTGNQCKIVDFIVDINCEVIL